MSDHKAIHNIILGCTGSVATIKVPLIAEKLKNLGFSVVIVPTANALHFLESQAIEDKINCHNTHNLEQKIKSLYPELEIVTDLDEWKSWKKRGDKIIHIDLREWADFLLLSPLDANTLAKIANGLCDNLLTCIVRAWNLNKPIAFCPAMNTQMYQHPFTMKHINILKELGFIEIPAISKKLMCGETGVGAMSEVDDIINTVMKYGKK